MSLSELSSSELEEVQKWILEISQKQKKILDVLEELKNELTNTEYLEKGLTKLVTVLKELPNDILDEKEVGLLLEFLIGKLEASALRNGCVVIGVHYLVLNSKNLPSNCAVPIFQSVFGESTVQCFSVNDRILLFDLLEYFLKEKLDDLKQLGSVFVYSFMRAVNGERDPRCLVQVFRLFLSVVKNFELGVYCEDFFELIAAYFPLQYVPTENQVSKEELNTLLENCLLSHNSFSFYCFSLVADRLAESSEDVNESLDVLGFLAKAAKIFNPEPMRGFIDDYLTSFRRITLDPSNKSADKVIHKNIDESLTAVIQAFGKEDKMVKQIAHTMTENCEPFVLQAEMGLTGKALNLLNVVAKSHKIAADTVLPQTMFWIGNLINADTINAPQNRKEIVTEAIYYVPEWLILAIECNCDKIANDSLPGYVESLKLAEEKYGAIVYEAEYKLTTIILKNKEKFSPFISDVNDLIKKLVWRAVSDLKRPEKDLKISIQQFISTLAIVDFELLNNLLESENREDDDTLIEVYLLGINDEVSLKIFSSRILNYLKVGNISEGFGDSMIHVFERNLEKNTVNNQFIIDILDIILSDGYAKSLDKIAMNILAETLQKIVIKFAQNQVNEFCQKIYDSLRNANPELFYLVYLVVLQTDNLELLNEFYKLFVLSAKELVKYVHFARKLRKFDGKIDDELPNDVKNSLKLMENKALFLLKDKNSISQMEEIFDEFIKTTEPKDWNLKDLFDFDNPAFNPERNLYPVSVLWRQRILYQTLPIYVKQFTKISKDDELKKSIYLSSLSSILSNASKLKIDFANELLQILPILIEAMETLKNVKNDELLNLILEGLIQLIKQTDLNNISKEDLVKIIINIHLIINNTIHGINTILKSLDVLELIGKKGNLEILMPTFTDTVKCLTKVTTSKKRIVRQKAAFVRNLWELTVA